MFDATCDFPGAVGIPHVVLALSKDEYHLPTGDGKRRQALERASRSGLQRICEAFARDFERRTDNEWPSLQPTALRAAADAGRWTAPTTRRGDTSG